MFIGICGPDGSNNTRLAKKLASKLKVDFTRIDNKVVAVYDIDSSEASYKTLMRHQNHLYSYLEQLVGTTERDEYDDIVVTDISLLDLIIDMTGERVTPSTGAIAEFNMFCRNLLGTLFSHTIYLDDSGTVKNSMTEAVEGCKECEKVFTCLMLSGKQKNKKRVAIIRKFLADY